MALNLAMIMLSSLALINVVIVFPVILALSAITFGVVGRSIIGLLSSGIFSIGLGVAVGLVFYVVAISNDFNTLGFPDPFNTPLLIAFSITFGILLSIIQLLLSLRRRHPATWDELTVLPLPNTRRLLSQRLQQNEAAGLELVSEIVRNSFQRWVAQQALQIYLHKQPAPLHLLYKLLADSDVDCSPQTPNYGGFETSGSPQFWGG